MKDILTLLDEMAINTQEQIKIAKDLQFAQHEALKLIDDALNQINKNG